MGPLVTKEAQERVLGYIDKGVEEGAELVIDGRELVVDGHALALTARRLPLSL